MGHNRGSSDCSQESAMSKSLLMKVALSWSCDLNLDTDSVRGFIFTRMIRSQELVILTNLIELITDKFNS